MRLEPLSLPDWSPDAGLMPDCRGPGRVPPNPNLPLNVRDGAPLAVLAVVPTEDCRVFGVGIGGGPIDGLPTPTAEGRLLEAAEGTRAFEGVFVRELDALEPAVASCFVGDLVGDCLMHIGQRFVF